MDSPAAMGFLITAVNGQPPHMMARQNAMTTEAIKHCVIIAVGGLTLPPTPVQCASITTAPVTAAIKLNRMPRRGCERSAAKRGCFIPHVTPMTISMGMMQIRHVEIHPENLGKSKSEIKPSEMAMMRAVAAIPRTGCLRPDKGRSFHVRTRLVILSQVTIQ